jgi:hypothetical protein
MKSLTAFSLIAIIILIGGCKRVHYDPTPREGTLRCLIDSVSWESTFTEAHYMNHILTIVGNIYKANNEEKDKLWILMWGQQDGKNHYSFNYKNQIQFARDMITTPTVGSWDYYDSSECEDQYFGEVTITELDTINQLISGKFSGTLFRPLNCQKKVVIREGIFYKLKITK